MTKIQSPYFCNPIFDGGLAQLARAFAWHAKGHRFDSGNLHKKGHPERFRDNLHHKRVIIPNAFGMFSTLKIL